MTQQERDHTAKIYKEIRRILFIHRHEQQSWDDIKLFFGLAFIGGLTYAAYTVIHIPGHFGW